MKNRVLEIFSTFKKLGLVLILGLVPFSNAEAFFKPVFVYQGEDEPQGYKRATIGKFERGLSPSEKEEVAYSLGILPENERELAIGFQVEAQGKNSDQKPKLKNDTEFHIRAVIDPKTGEIQKIKFLVFKVRKGVITGMVTPENGLGEVSIEDLKKGKTVVVSKVSGYETMRISAVGLVDDGNKTTGTTAAQNQALSNGALFDSKVGGKLKIELHGDIDEDDSWRPVEVSVEKVKEQWRLFHKNEEGQKLAVSMVKIGSWYDTNFVGLATKGGIKGMDWIADRLYALNESNVPGTPAEAEIKQNSERTEKKKDSDRFYEPSPSSLDESDFSGRSGI